MSDSDQHGLGERDTVCDRVDTGREEGVTTDKKGREGMGRVFFWGGQEDT